MPTLENVSFALRAGIEAPGTISPRGEDTVVTHVPWLSASTVLVATLGVLFVGCGTPPGQPRAGSITLAPNDVVEFDALYADNCAGCHGANGRGGAAIALANPVYLAIVDERSMRATIADGVRGTSMPAFAQRAGGMLTEKQIDATRRRHPIALERSRRARWRESAFVCRDVRRRHSPRRSGVPDILPVVPRRGRSGRPEGKRHHERFVPGADERSGAANDGDRGPSRAGRSRLARIRWPGRPMSDQEVTDVVSWLASHRVAAPGQPYATATTSRSSRVE